MKKSFSRVLAFVSGLLLVVFVGFSQSSQIAAAPLQGITPSAQPPTPTTRISTSTAEPPTPTDTAQPPTPTNTVEPPTPTDTVTPIGDTPTATVEPPAPTATDIPATPTALPPIPTQGRVETDPDPLVSKRAGSSRARVGEELEFILTVTNRGDKPALDVVVVDPLPDFLQYVSSSASRGTITVNGNQVMIVLGSVANDEMIEIRILTRVLRIPTPPNDINTVELSTSSRGDEPINNRDEVPVDFIEAPLPDTNATSVPGDVPPPSGGVADAPAVSLPTPTSPPPPASDATTTPKRLPTTGANDQILWVLLALGLGLIMLSLIPRRLTRK